MAEKSASTMSVFWDLLVAADPDLYSELQSDVEQSEDGDGAAVQFCETPNEISGTSLDDGEQNTSSSDNGSEQTLTCPSCVGYPIESWEQLRAHQRYHRGESIIEDGYNKKTDRYRCTMCPGDSGKEYVNRGNLYAHQGSHRSHVCGHCGDAFPKRAQLTYHVKKHHDSTLPHQCDDCSWYFSTDAGLHTHRKKVHGAKDPELKCDWCAKKFTTNCRLASHKLQHVFTCVMCGTEYTDKHKFDVDKCKPFKCYCGGWESYSESELTTHVQRCISCHFMPRGVQAGFLHKWECGKCSNECLEDAHEVEITFYRSADSSDFWETT